LGLIGYGLFGAHHARAIAAGGGGVAGDCRAIRAIAAGGPRGLSEATIYSDYRELLARDDIDAVDVGPESLHYEVGGRY